jgi:hypothetical protein
MQMETKWIATVTLRNISKLEIRFLDILDAEIQNVINCSKKIYFISGKASGSESDLVLLLM